MKPVERKKNDNWENAVQRRLLSIVVEEELFDRRVCPSVYRNPSVFYAFVFIDVTCGCS